ncbi:MAG: hypothetical protein LIO40_02910 [Ruminococcus sp.]|nr:hypothetical protein [Ruminococcus sp.]
MDLYESRDSIEYSRALKKFYGNQLTLTSIQSIIKEWDEDDHPRDERGRFTDSTGSSPSGANDFKIKDFRNKQKLNNHWNKHSAEYTADGITNKNQFKKRALELIESKTGENILGHIDKDGVVVRYDIEKNDFVKGHPEKGIYTMFKPEEGQTYYDTKLKEDIEHGGET